MKNSSLFSKISLIQLSILFCFVPPPNALSKNKNPDPNQNLNQINKIYKGLHKGYSHKIKKQKELVLVVVSMLLLSGRLGEI